MSEYFYFVSYAVNDLSMGITSNPARIDNTVVILEEPITTHHHVISVEKDIALKLGTIRRRDEKNEVKLVSFQFLRVEPGPSIEG